LDEDDIIIHENQLSAYLGEIGNRRAEFCRTYTTYKRTALADIVAGINREAQAKGKTIYCHKGCTVCCHVYVVASLQECEAIVHYLYQQEAVMRHFVDAFRSWRRCIEVIRDSFFDIGHLQQKRLSHIDTKDDDKAFSAALLKYTKQNIPCPFLKDGACLIYEVRPYACAGLVSTTPSSWCTASHPSHKKIVLLRADVNLDSDPPYFANPVSEVFLTNMPALVYEIIRYGWVFLSRVPGCSHLKNEIGTL